MPNRNELPGSDVACETITVRGALTVAGVAVNGGGPAASSYLGRQVFTASGTYTPTAGARRVLVRMVGGGGGGGGSPTVAGTNVCIAQGGGSGVYWEKLFQPGALITGGAVVIGASGTAGAATPTAGGNGGDTSVVIQGTTYTAKGGFGGAVGSSLASPISVGSQAAGSIAGSSAGYDVVQAGRGTPGHADNAALSGWGCSGGASVMGYANGPINLIGVGGTAVGQDGQGFGTGGGGGIVLGGSGAAVVGGLGAPGTLLIDEWT